MSLIPTVYRSTDPGAPQLTGQAGALLSVLRGVLVTGYGTGPSAKAAAGWTEVFTGTNKAVFRSNVVSSSGAHYQLDDTGTVGSAQQALIRAFKSMSSLDTGDDPAPTPTQSANGMPIAKSTSLDGVARPWMIIANERAAYLFVSPWATATAPGHVYFLGDVLSMAPGDGYQYGVSYPGFATFTSTIDASSTVLAGGGTHWERPEYNCLYLGRSGSGIPGAVSAYSVGGKSPRYYPWGGVQNATPYPCPTTGGLLYTRALVYEEPQRPRGRFPGVLVPLHDRPFTDGSTVSGIQGLPGNVDALVVNYYAEVWASVGPLNQGQLLFEINKEWT